MSAGLLLLGHGAREALWAAPFRAVVERIQAAHAGVPVELAFLELMTPDLYSAANTLAQQGCQQVCIVPLFLGTGGHVRRELPLMVERVRTDHPDIRWTLGSAIGEHPGVIDAIASAAAESLA